MSLYFKIRKWLQPYWNPAPKPVVHEERDDDEDDDDNVHEEADLVQIKVLKAKKPLDAMWAAGKAPSVGAYWCYHDLTKHQVCAFLPKGTAFSYKGRDDERRSKLKPLLYPRQDKAYDRTHLVPFGYHGSENHQALVVGWDSNQNRNELREFEMNMNRRNQKSDLYLMTLLERKKGYATWEYLVFDGATKKCVDKLSLKLECDDWAWT